MKRTTKLWVYLIPAFFLLHLVCKGLFSDISNVNIEMSISKLIMLENIRYSSIEVPSALGYIALND